MSTKLDVNGKESSKRKHGGRFLTATLIVCLAYFVLNVFSWWIGKDIFDFPTQLVTILASVGTALLGVTVFEKFKPKE